MTQECVFCFLNPEFLNIYTFLNCYEWQEITENLAESVGGFLGLDPLFETKVSFVKRGISC